MRVCLVYDCLFPWTIGGAERWMRSLAEALVADGHDVTYLTRRQWPEEQHPEIPGVRVVAVSRDEPLYGPDGNRTIGEPLRFGWGVMRHLHRHGREYDVVHTASFPYFSLLAAGRARRRSGYRLVVDWHEVWSSDYWATYLGGIRGRVAERIQRACIRTPHQAYCFAQLTAERLEELGLAQPATVLRGEYDGPLDPPDPAPAEPLAVFAGRMIPEKRAPAVVPAILRARQEVEDLTGVLFGDGPELPLVRQAISDAGAERAISAPGFVSAEQVDSTLARACCLVMPTTREGYGQVVVEAFAAGVPCVLVAGPDNAATEHIEEGVNGFVVASADPDVLGAAIVRCWQDHEQLRASTIAWFRENAQTLSAASSVAQVVEGYRTTRR